VTVVDLFVGREHELQASLDLLAVPGEGAVRDIVGVRGVGKSSFLHRLSDRARQLKLPGQEVRVYNLDMQQHGLGVGFLPGDLGANASLDIVREVFTTSRQLLGSIAEDQREFKGFRLLSQKLWNEVNFPAAPSTGITLGKHASIGTAEIRVMQPDDAAFRRHIRALQSQLDDGFTEAWEEFTARRRVLITVDTFQLAADNELGRWFIRMAGQLRNTLTVLARTPSDASLWQEGAGLDQIQLPFFTIDEITDYLQRRLGTSAPLRELAATTLDFTDGHPEGVNLAGDLIMNKGGAELSAAELRQTLDSLPTEGDQFWAGLVVEILQAVRGDDLLSAVEAASVAGIFDGSLLAELISPGNPQQAAVGEIIAKLSGLGMLHQIPAISGGPSDRFRLHEFIRQAVAFRLHTNTPAAWQRLQSVTAQRYFRRLKKWDEDAYDSYGAWYRFEDPRWQDCKREWLRHSGLALDRAFVTRSRFTLVFLQAFWWWGVYRPFPFMRWLLDDWARVSAEWARTQAAETVPLGGHEDPDQLLLTALTELINDYPQTHIKPRTSPWDAIRDNLIRVRTLCGLSPAGGLSPAAKKRATEEEQAEIIRTDAFITLFLAHSRRFRDPADPSAGRFYEAALTAFRELKDEWTSAWLVFECSDMALERDDLRSSAELVAEGAASAKKLGLRTEEWDRELLANLHRTWADICWRSQRLDEAGRHYGWAVAHGYWFQGEPSAVDGEPHGPDQYTQQFYREMTLRVATRIAKLASDPPQWERFVAEMLREVPRDSAEVRAADWLRATISELQEVLFPRAPAENELRWVDTLFMERWSILYLDRHDLLAGLEDLIHASLDEQGAEPAGATER
jgi:hypothetical protein